MRDPGRDPRRLSGGEGTGFERQLLAAAKGEHVPADLKLRMQEGLGLTGGSGAAAAAAGAGGAKATLILWTSIGILGVGFGGGVLGGRLFSRPAVPATTAAPVAAAPAQVAAVAAPAEAPPSVEAVAVKVPTHARRAPSRPAAGGGDVRAEMALVDAARQAVAARAPSEALDVLRRYEARFPRGTFAPEAAALHVEALELGGAHREAQARARAFIAAHPDSPLAERIARIAR